MVETKGQTAKRYHYLTPLFAGGVAGLTVDLALYPLDTLKTRLQSEQGFYKAGGFKGVYKGLGAVATGSVPTSSLFFVSYEFTKSFMQPHIDIRYAPAVHMLAACVGEVLACVIRVPMEIMKQRKQTYVGTMKRSSLSILLQAYRNEGLRLGVYRGFLSTVARDLPFSFIELPVWEALKTSVRQYKNSEITSFESAVCGSIAGGFAAAVTTPLDLAKTRIMLAQEYAVTRKLQVIPVLVDIYTEAGFRGLFVGIVPRLTAFTLGGFVFFGAYEQAKAMIKMF